MAPDKLNFANGRVFFESRGLTFAQAAGLAEESSDPRRRRLVQAAARAGALQGRGRGTVAGVFVHRVRGRSRGRSRHRLDHRSEDLDRARHRQGHQPGACARQVEGSVYMGLSEALMEEQVFRRLPPKLSGALVHKIPSLLEYKSLTSLDMPEVDTVLVEDPTRTARSAPRKSGRDRCFR